MEPDKWVMFLICFFYITFGFAWISVAVIKLYGKFKNYRRKAYWRNKLREGQYCMYSQVKKLRK